MKESTLRWYDINDSIVPMEKMTGRCIEPAAAIIKSLGGKSFEITGNIGELDAAVKNLITDTLGYKPSISTSTLRRHGLLKYEVRDDKAYCVFTRFAPIVN